MVSGEYAREGTIVNSQQVYDAWEKVVQSQEQDALIRFLLFSPEATDVILERQRAMAEGREIPKSSCVQDTRPA